jgi:hypothetical protein
VTRWLERRGAQYVACMAALLAAMLVMHFWGYLSTEWELSVYRS